MDPNPHDPALLLPHVTPMTFPSASNFAVHTLQSRPYARPRWLHVPAYIFIFTKIHQTTGSLLMSAQVIVGSNETRYQYRQKMKRANEFVMVLPVLPCHYPLPCACSKQFCPPHLCVEKSVQHANHCKQRVPQLPATGLMEFNILFSKPQILFSHFR